MSAQTPMFPPIPAETASAVTAMFGKGNNYVIVGDRLEILLARVDLSRLDHVVTPTYSPLIYTLVTVFQFNERLPDRRAAEALRSRLDWKYALHLSLTHPGIIPLALCEFRRQLWHNSLGLQTFEDIVAAVAACGLSPINSEASTDVSDILASICNLSRLEQITDTLRAALETLAANRPEWLLRTARPCWYDRYTTRQSLRDLSSTMPDQLTLTQAIGEDAAHLLDAIDDEPDLAQLPEIRLLQRVYSGQFDLIESSARWRLPFCLSCSLAT